MAIPRWAWAVIIIGALCVIAVIALAGAGVYFVTRQVQVREASPARAQDLFDQNRQRFKDATPLIELDSDGEIVRTHFDEALRRKPVASTTPLEALHVVAWDADESKVVQVAIPFWLLRLKRGPIEVFSETAGLRRADIRITVEDLEALGPSLIVDHRGRHGDRVLAWTQ